jgi:hypothetical protein
MYLTQTRIAILLIGGAALAVLVVAPIVGVAMGAERAQSLSESGRNLVKEGIKLSIETAEIIQNSTAKASESWNNLVTEAQAEIELKHKSAQASQEAEITLEG